MGEEGQAEKVSGDDDVLMLVTFSCPVQSSIKAT